MPESNVYGNVGVPRIYLDYVQLASALNLIDKYTLENGIGGGDEDPSLAWDFNPTNMISYTLRNQVKWASFRVYLKYWEDESNIQFRRLLSTANYNMILGLDATGTTRGNQYSYGKFSYYESEETGWVGQPPPTKHIIVGEGGSGALHYADTLGYAIQHYPDGWNNDYGFGYSRIEYNFANKTDDDAGDDNFQVGDILKIGSLSFGKYFDLPHNADVDVSLGFDFSGITRNKTVSGDTLTQINYKRPKWGDLRAWTNIDLTPYQEQGIDPKQALLDQDYSTTGLQGRRSWNLSFSYISKDDMFPKNFDGNMGGDYESTELGELSTFTWDEDSSIVSSWANATLGFQLPFILQPDKNKQDFAIVKAKANSIKVSQQAPMLYKFSITLIEQY